MGGQEENHMPEAISNTHIESKRERAERKAIFMSRATAHFDTPEIRKEAEEMWEKANPQLINPFYRKP